MCGLNAFPAGSKGITEMKPIIRHHLYYCEQVKHKMCDFCLKPGDKICGRCKTAVYCTEEHQKIDWPNHKPNCKQYNPLDSIVVKKQNVSSLEESKTQKIDKSEKFDKDHTLDRLLDDDTLISEMTKI